MVARMSDAPEPPPRKFAFKPKEFERVNAPRPESAAADAAAPTPAPVPAANDVFAIRQELREREKAAGLDELKPADRPNSTRRRRDYWFLLLAGNIAIVGTAAIVGLNVMTAAFAFSGVVLYSIGLTWIMWSVMDRY